MRQCLKCQWQIELMFTQSSNRSGMEEISSQGVCKKPHPLKFIIKMVWVSIFMIVTFDVAIGVFIKHYQVVIDYVDEDKRCIPEHSVYLLKKGNLEVERGKIYTFFAQGMSPFYPDNTLISKYVVGLPNDVVVQNEQGIFINDSLIATGYPSIDKLNRPEASFYRSYVLGEGEYFFTAPAERSFDSRYWGTVKQQQIIGEAIPLW
ncbi:hypothetical protein FXE74_18875 [Vibrio cholerae]|nr:hypothetical protein FXE74_18875 [Vibrio cholerae]